MSIKRLPFFLSAAKYLNFTEAANEQFISQTAMSLQIKKYEDELGFQLFHRSNTGVTLTKAGGYLYKRCQYIMADYNQAISHARQVSQEDKPLIKIGYLGAVSYTHLDVYKRQLQYRGSFLKDRGLGQIADLHLAAHADLRCV